MAFKDPRRQAMYEACIADHDHLIRGNNTTANAYKHGYFAAARGWPRHHASYPAWTAGRDNRKRAYRGRT
jgi:hypothetical protein